MSNQQPLVLGIGDVITWVLKAEIQYCVGDNCDGHRFSAIYSLVLNSFICIKCNIQYRHRHVIIMIL